MEISCCPKPNSANEGHIVVWHKKRISLYWEFTDAFYSDIDIERKRELQGQGQCFVLAYLLTYLTALFHPAIIPSIHPSSPPPFQWGPLRRQPCSTIIISAVPNWYNITNKFWLKRVTGRMSVGRSVGAGNIKNEKTLRTSCVIVANERALNIVLASSSFRVVATASSFAAAAALTRDKRTGNQIYFFSPILCPGRSLC